MRMWNEPGVILNCNTSGPPLRSHCLLDSVQMYNKFAGFGQQGHKKLNCANRPSSAERSRTQSILTRRVGGGLESSYLV